MQAKVNVVELMVVVENGVTHRFGTGCEVRWLKLDLKRQAKHPAVNKEVGIEIETGRPDIPCVTDLMPVELPRKLSQYELLIILLMWFLDQNPCLSFLSDVSFGVGRTKASDGQAFDIWSH
ncbi:hypothetical protein ACH5RR_026290 [Cinchona calisaya]|uniref:Uncharacterized protein n=1 Tax=Cinchona calisaya TaxID=153742 RepID=A0ABD2Z765_9GENT